MKFSALSLQSFPIYLSVCGTSEVMSSIVDSSLFVIRAKESSQASACVCRNGI